MNRLTLLLLLLTSTIPASAIAEEGEQTVGWFHRAPATYGGYSFFAPGRDSTTYLIDEIGRVVHSWPSDFNPGASSYLLEGGDILRTARIPGNPPISAGGTGGRVERIAWDGTLMWSFEYSSAVVQHHHDVEPLPNGNLLLVAWELKSVAEATAAGRDPTLLPDNQLWPDHIIEVEPGGTSGGTIVWEWHAWDHLVQDLDPTLANFGVVADHPEKIDLNYIGTNAGADWLHVNSVDYNAELDQIMLSVPTFAEVWIIDHSTSTAEAASSSGGLRGHGGDLLYRWGNPRTYQAGTTANQMLFFQHCAEWIAPGLPGAGNVIVFNNGVNRPGGNASSVDELVPPIDSNGDYLLDPGSSFGPAALQWTYMAPIPTDLYGRILGGVQRLPNGNTLLCEGAHGNFIEVTDGGSEVWRYVNPVGPGGPYTQGVSVPTSPVAGDNTVFRVQRYSSTSPQLIGRDLTAGEPIENYPLLGDFDDSSSISTLDFNCFASVFTGPCSATPCADTNFNSAMAFFGDFDFDGDVDCTDWDSFQLAWTGPPASAPDFGPCLVVDSLFLRGDSNLDQAINVADVVTILGYLFSGDSVGCLQSCDTNDDESNDISDAIALLSFLFGSGVPLPAPYPDCGLDGTANGALTCETPATCP
ncbi:MAG: aryl-sulfate sulfotransferase [Planctomycetota bacterium]|nr:aryl-sulfate sulfotransferase [Planctomycetota bacterium]